DSKSKPLILATGAASMDDVMRAVSIISNDRLVLMQCNTNYTLEKNKHKFVNINVLNKYKEKFPNIVLGLSDHTLGHGSVLGSIAIGSRVIEKHFTDDNDREGPDHKFALNPTTWRQMVDMGNEVFETLGDGVKKVEENEKNAFIVQRRSITVKRSLSKGQKIEEGDIEFLRPCPKNSFHPFEKDLVVGKILNNEKHAGESILKDDIC
ncbi:N-acetylneuraminate synthase family protein, partial [Gammaproteobacteria bacterium]|nr:N-acetylneuraminate synthase family protein [Gammaproteobacteria bacterium]